MSTVISTKGLSKSYGKHRVLSDVNLNIEQGRIVGLIGPNGAGKTTALRSLLGLSRFEGEVNVLGLDPRKQHKQLMQEVCFIADTAIMPYWLKVAQCLEYLQEVHPNFNPEKAQKFLAATNIGLQQKVAQLSKGMVTQLHLALVMAIEAKVLVLDEPTLGLDILYRKQFYTSLLNDYFDEQRTIIITTHQVEEVASILTDLIFIKEGELVLEVEMEELPNRFIELEASGDNVTAARALNPLGERPVLGGSAFIFDDVNNEQLQALGKTRTPSVSDLFVAKMQA